MVDVVTYIRISAWYDGMYQWLSNLNLCKNRKVINFYRVLIKKGQFVSNFIIIILSITKKKLYDKLTSINTATKKGHRQYYFNSRSFVVVWRITKVAFLTKKMYKSIIKSDKNQKDKTIPPPKISKFPKPLCFYLVSFEKIYHLRTMWLV